MRIISGRLVCSLLRCFSLHAQSQNKENYSMLACYARNVLFHPAKRLSVTFHDNRSIELKATYVMDKKLNGIMFWQIAHNKQNNSLLVD